MIVAMSTQLLSGPSPGPRDANPFIDAAMSQEKSLVCLAVRRLLLNYISRTPPSGKTYLYSDGDSPGIFERVGSAAATFVLLPLNYLVNNSGDGSKHPLAEFSLHVLLILTNYHKPIMSDESLTDKSDDSATSESVSKGHAFSSGNIFSKALANARDVEFDRSDVEGNAYPGPHVRIPFASLFDTLGMCLADEGAVLLLYSLLQGNSDFKEYVLVRTDLDTMCNLGGNYEEMGVDTMSEMDVYETPYENNTITVPHKGSHRNPLIMSTGVSSISRCFSARKSSKRWKRRQHYYQQRARQERLNNSRKWKGEVSPEELNLKMYVVEETGKQGMVDSICLDDNYKPSEESEVVESVVTFEETESSLKSDLVSDNSQLKSERDNKECCEVKASSSPSLDYNSSSERKKPNHKSKRCYDEDLDNPKASKCHRPSTDTANLSYKYSSSSFCSTEDSLPDGFFDAGRDRPFMPLSRYEKILPLDSREVILLDRGYLDFMPHAWNVVHVKRGDSWVRMVVDACRPHDIREYTDQEYFCRYIPLNRLSESICARAELEPGSPFSSLSTGEGVERANSSLIRCKLGSTEAALKMRTLEVSGASVDDIRTFEYTCLGEVRILGALKHDCIVELYGHEISSKWITSENGNEHRRILQSSILMEYIEGGSLKGHIEKLSEDGKHHVPMDLALSIARDISGALMELHSKDIIHRDIKSENVLIDLDNQKANGEEPVVKLCDFDRAVPLRSHLHGCCIAHVGIPPANVCVGTPRWMSPEVFRAMHEQNFYGLEVDIWSFGCLIFELLTLQIPYFDLSELQIHESLQKGKRPKLPEELETLISETEEDDESANKLREEYDLTESDLDTMRFLIDVFRLCTEESPLDRLNAGDLHEMILSWTKSKSPTGTASTT
ncbi:hypothetical protein F2Q68_00012824 [Brassica cretica]|uniref:Protein kinase domain-containing protein n=1 Tax=Brassica cretica TaxID=69181 RepID=A0A8S9HR38_BRACR|nr:hypothetical protein F2Q68_00012824 [Brassica cretica]